MKSLDPATLLTHLGIDFIERPNRLAFCCPWHDDTDPSSGFYLDTERWFCFACELTLDTISFYAKAREISRREAEIELEKTFGTLKEREEVDPRPKVRHRFRGEDRLKEARRRMGEKRREEHAYLGEQLDNLLMLYERGHLSAEGLDNGAEIWYNMVRRAENGTDPRRTPGISAAVGVQERVGDLFGAGPQAGDVDLD